MAKKCKVEGCNNPVFTHGYCNIHKYLYYKTKRSFSTSLKQSIPKTPIRAFSKKKSLKKAKIASIKSHLVQSNGNRCFFCNKETGVDAAHIFPISLFPEYETEQWNIILACRKHHNIFDNGTFDDILQIPNINFILELIESVDGLYFYRLKQRGNK